MVAWLPNALTAARLVAIVPFTILLATADDAVSLPAAALFAAASLTDFLDGYLARRAGTHSRFGRIVDPLADRILINITLVLLVYHDRLPWWLAVPVLFRDAVLATVFRLRRVATEVRVNFAGKTATAAIMVALALLMVTERDWPLALYAVGLGLSLAAAALYFRQAEEGLRSKPS